MSEQTQSEPKSEDTLTPKNSEIDQKRTPIWKYSLLTTLGLVAAIGGYLVFASATAEAKEPLGKQWQKSQLVSMNDIDHSKYDQLLQKYVDENGYVDYQSWKNSKADRKSLRDYLTELSRASTDLPATNSATLAFWINTYNAVTIEGILQVYPTPSIRKHTSKLGGYNIWDDLPLYVGNRQYSLNAMEHDIMRKMNEPRIHFAIVCASVGCPRLYNRAYTAEKLEEQLVTNAKDFFSRSQNFEVSDDGRTIRVSSILDWFGDDFGANQQERWQKLAPYVPEEHRETVTNSETRVKYQKYDWSLNAQHN